MLPAKGEKKEFVTAAFQEIHFKMRIMNYGKVSAEDMVHNISSRDRRGPVVANRNPLSYKEAFIGFDILQQTL